MSARAPASLRAFAAIVVAAQLINAEIIPCHRDGLYADYDKNCREYVKCAGGIVKGRYTCGPDRVFSELAGACVPRRRQPCIRRECAPRDTFAYATPGTACRHYYRCENGTAIDHSCPSGAWFDLELQACTRGAGTCYEPLCAGLTDGEYPDSSHECRRMLVCRGAELRGVFSCAGGTCVDSCPAPRSAAIPLPAGDADFCSDEACSSLCHQAKDGAYADRVTGCREYFVCEARRVIRRGVCEPGLLFSGNGCEPAARTICPPPARSPCYNWADGLYRDWRDCSSWFECRRERVVARGFCEPGLVFNGTTCVPTNAFVCEGPERRLECQGLPSGTYQDLESNCTRYFHCEGSMRTMLACEPGYVFDGVRCTSMENYLCPSLGEDSCYGRPDGRYRGQHTQGCRGYYTCTAGEKAIYACASGRVFDGESCVPARPGVCPVDDYSCSSLSDGYHAEIKTGCHRYFYCEGGDRLATFSCLGGKIFDGHACVDPSTHKCGAPPREIIENGGKYCEHNGFFVQLGSGCQRYYFCVKGMRTFLTCPVDHLFNGQICVPKSQYTCPG
ncbi:uncharacterized protein LOC113517017 [Galleria mellonella]|uniref:Uncharacterized protein LOC113517017 n=1 Tax=Galleria mellonella TaxID=7137 RepID=A0A6J1WQC7_GALME|nr:uncharacterized protein LOC113517017 [Galleria mellonella]